MPRTTLLDQQWEALMALCQQEARLQSENHPRLLAFVSGQIVQLAREMGFTDRQIQTREFRAERKGRHIIRVATE
jgi:AraC-like DNA-binding protein